MSFLPGRDDRPVAGRVQAPRVEASQPRRLRAMAGAIGEGASDALAVFMNLDDRIGEYAFADAEGIRSAPYATLKKDYSSMTGVEVHDDGEVYGRIAWLLLQGYQDAGLGAGDLLATWVDGFNYTPAAPTMTTKSVPRMPMVDVGVFTA